MASSSLAQDQFNVMRIIHHGHDFEDDPIKLVRRYEKFEEIHKDSECNVCMEKIDGMPYFPCQCPYFRIHKECVPDRLYKCERCKTYYGTPRWNPPAAQRRSEPNVQVCRGQTRNGQPCRRRVSGGQYCFTHRPPPS